MHDNVPLHLIKKTNEDLNKRGQFVDVTITQLKTYEIFKPDLLHLVDDNLLANDILDAMQFVSYEING